MKRGRKSTYTKAKANQICALLEQGVSLQSICKMEGMPERTVVLDWLSKDEEFATQYTKARERQIELMAEQIVDIADNGTNDWMQSNDPDNPGYRFNGEHYQRSRLRVDTRKWVASKLLPKKYGERKEINITSVHDLSADTIELLLSSLGAEMIVANAEEDDDPDDAEE